jgi:hypothetical protein
MKSGKPKNIKLHILSRPSSKKALIIVKHPKLKTGFFGFDFSTHEVVEGQWLNGKVYERRSDLSHDGKYIIYFAAKFHLQGKNMAFTALSKFPYFKAVDYHAKGHTWNGGGLFLSETEYLLNETYSSDEVTKNSLFKIKKGKLNNLTADEETEGIYYPRLRRDGWKDEGETEEFQLFTFSYKGWTIRKECRCNFDEKKQGKSMHYDINELYNPKKELVMRIESDWMEFRNDNVYWADGGKIYCAPLNAFDKKEEIMDLLKFGFKSITVNYD